MDFIVENNITDTNSVPPLGVLILFPFRVRGSLSCHGKHHTTTLGYYY